MTNQNFTDRLYRDEPLLFTAEHLAKRTPERILAMRRLAHASSHAAKVFRIQGKFMAEYEDECGYAGDFVQYFPTYQSMTDAQLRGYFTWRTKARKGNLERTSLSFAFVHVYELLNQIGVDTPEDGFHALKNFWTSYRELDSRLDAYVPLWIKDFVIYHDLDISLLHGGMDETVDDALSTLFGTAEQDGDKVFAALDAVSSYKLAESRFYKLHPEECRAAAVRAFAVVREYYDTRPGKSAGETFFGKLCSSHYAMFKSAVVHHDEDHPDAVYELARHHRYVCKNGVWRCERFLGYGDSNKRIGALLKTVDFLMRREYGMNSTLQPGKTNKVVTAKIEKEIQKFLAESRAREPARIDLDLSRLQGIRDAALVTRDRLLVEEEREERVEEKKEAELLPPSPPAGEMGLSDAESRFLHCLLSGLPYAGMLRGSGLMASVLVDAINEKLFDRFGDTVIDDAGDVPHVREEYRAELTEQKK